MSAHNSPPSAEPSGVMAACSLAAAGVAVATLAELPALRERPGGPNSRTVPPRFLRHADEQTVVGLAAVLRAMDDPALADENYATWGVIAAPVLPGRLGGAATFTKFREGGPAAISPHIIPQNSLHSVAGAISVGLGLHGPNFGIGGGPEALAEGLTVALSLVDDTNLPGLWLVLTQWTPEPVPDGRGSTATETTCSAIALALRAQAGPGVTLRMTLPGSRALTASSRDACDSRLEQAPADHGRLADGREALAELARWLAAEPACRQSAPWSFGLPWGGQVELVQEQYHQQAKAA
jgi:hypothetical protein